MVEAGQPAPEVITRNFDRGVQRRGIVVAIMASEYTRAGELIGEVDQNRSSGRHSSSMFILQHALECRRTRELQVAPILLAYILQPAVRPRHQPLIAAARRLIEHA